VIPSRLSESVVKEAPAGRPNPVEKPVEDLITVFGLVEAQPQEVVHESTGL